MSPPSTLIACVILIFSSLLLYQLQLDLKSLKEKPQSRRMVMTWLCYWSLLLNLEPHLTSQTACRIQHSPDLRTLELAK